MRVIALLILSLAVVAASAATVYRWVDENGTVVFGDDPPAGSDAQPVDVPPANVIQAPAAPSPSAPPAMSDEGPQSTDQGYASIAIVYPENDSSVRQNAGNVSVRVQLDPDLHEGDKLELVMDGRPVASSTSGEFELSNIDRGTHRVVARVVDKTGNSVIESAPVRFTLHRFSQLGPTAR